MKKIDAQIECLKGQKIYCTDWTGDKKRHYIYFNGTDFRFVDTKFDEEVPVVEAFNHPGNWEIYIPYVNFTEAIQAYKEGKTIESIITDEVYKLRDFESIHNGPAIYLSEIEGGWIIHE